MRNKILFGVGLFALLITLIMVGLPFLVPQTTAKSFLNNQTQSAIGRELRINSNFHWQLIPQVRIRAEDVQLANADWAKEPIMLRLGSVELHLALWSLLQSKAEIAKLTVSDAQIVLETSQSGQNNWEFADSQTESNSTDRSRQSSSFQGLLAQNIAIRRTQIIINDQQRGVHRKITDFEFEIPRLDFESPLQISSGFIIDGNHAHLEARVSHPKALVNAEASEIDFNLDIPNKAQAKIGGNITLGKSWAKTQSDLTANLEIPYISHDVRKFLAKFIPDGMYSTFSAHVAQLESIHLRGHLKKLASQQDSIMLDAQIGYRGRTIKVASSFEAEETNLFQAKINLRNEEAELSYTGKAGFEPQLQADGQYRIRMTSVQKLADYFNYADVPRIPMNDIDISGDIQIVDNIFAFSSNGSLRTNNEPVRLNIELSSENGINSRINTNSKVRIPGAEAEFDGTLELEPSLMLDGQANVQINSPENIFAWLDITLPAFTEKISAQSEIHYADDGVRLTQLKVIQGEQTLTGELNLLGIGTQNQLKGKLLTTNFNLEKILGPKTDSSSAQASKQKQGWDNTPIDLSPLRKYGAELSLSMVQADLYGLKLDQVTLQLQANNGDISMKTDQLKLYGGNGSINAKLDARTEPYVIIAEVNLSDIEMPGLLSGLSGLSRLEGTLKMNGKMTMRGTSQAEFASSLESNGRFTAKHGSIRGINIPNKLHGILKALMVEKDPAEQTEYTGIKASWKASKGILKNDDFILTSSIMKIPGSGIVDIPSRTIDYQIRAQLASLSPDRSTMPTDGKFAIPIRISGPWNDPSIRPDLSAMHPDLLNLLDKKYIQGTTRTLHKISKKIKEQLDSALDSLLPDLGR